MSNITSLRISEEETQVVKSKKKIYFIFGSIAIFVTLTVIIKFIIVYWRRKDEIIHEVGVSLPETWYYNRTVMDMQLCQEDEPVVREEVLIGYISRSCSDVESCIKIVRAIANDANFFITIGHVFEGYGWNCNVTNVLTVKFLGIIDFNEALLYYVLLKDGIADHEMSPTMRVFVDETSCDYETCSFLRSLGAPHL
ncbi:uncharacterized protein [Halyomorpha halys]|uniref:uncharacterized protein n=1 Tax=Halyomorpha halys TaxID=286706 RepID=UPI0006D4E6D8|nr:uncharacterized protein LOC106685292 [Halyomorpha halys]XP_014283362.1 uncharacterized protein LOC106685292 [Halyomorpha halys]